MSLAHRVVLALALVPLLGACGSSGDGGAPVIGHPAAPAGDAVVTVHVEDVPGGPLFTEGYVPDVRLVTTDGRAIRTDDDHHPVFRGLAPGTYVIRAAVRPCDGNCSLLDPPQDTCRRTIAVKDAFEATMLVRPGKPCHLRVDSRS